MRAGKGDEVWPVGADTHREFLFVHHPKSFLADLTLETAISS